MCGIAGLFAHGADAPPVDRTALAAMGERMRMRGPDGEGAWVDPAGRIGLTHRRLSIIDLSDAALQPMASADGRRAIVFNGEIYNYRSLRDELAAQGRRFVTQSDTEVLLHLYARDGAAMLDRLRGMFAFALWDADRQGILLARDGFGIKPLYYADDGRTLRFASQVKALIAGGGIDLAPDPAGRVGFFIWGHVPEPWTTFRNIRALPAGMSMWIDRNGARKPVAHFDPVGEARKAEAAPRAFDAGELREALLDSVRHHLVADVPVGAFLSAGLDSSTLVALASEIATEPLSSVTLAFDEYKGTAFDEAPLAETVAAACGTDHRTCRVRGQDFRDEYARLCAAMDQPSVDGVNTYFVGKATAESGLKVALSGLGGDELFGGYDSFRQIPRMVGLLAPFGRLPAVGRGFRLLSAPLLRAVTSPKYASLFEYGGSYGDAYLLRRALYLPWELPQVMDPDMAAEGWRTLDAESGLRHQVDGIGSARLKVSVLEATRYMRSQLLRDADWAGMAHSLEIRVPLVDTALFRRLAPMLAGTRPPTKRDMALTPLKPLPTALLDRPKTGFFVPVREWLTGQSSQAAERGQRGWARRIFEDSAR